MISLEKLKISTPLQKLPENVGDLGTNIVANCFESCPKSNKSHNLVTLLITCYLSHNFWANFCAKILLINSLGIFRPNVFILMKELWKNKRVQK